MRVVIIVQARMGSTRLPGKVLKPLAGAPMLQRQLERLQRCRHVDKIVVATTESPKDDAIVQLAEQMDGIGIFRGPEDDVLARFLGAARAHDADVVVRVTADCPLIDPEVIDAAIELYAARQPKVSYVSNGFIRTYPRGLDVEVFPFCALKEAEAETASASDREHVTPFIWRQPDRYPRADLVDSDDNSALRWTVDTPEDLRLVTEVYERLYPTDPEFGYRDVLNLMAAEPQLAQINAHIEQKPV